MSIGDIEISSLPNAIAIVIASHHIQTTMAHTLTAGTA